MLLLLLSPPYGTNLLGWLIQCFKRGGSSAPIHCLNVALFFHRVSCTGRYNTIRYQYKPIHCCLCNSNNISLLHRDKWHQEEFFLNQLIKKTSFLLAEHFKKNSWLHISTKIFPSSLLWPKLPWKFSFHLQNSDDLFLVIDHKQIIVFSFPNFPQQNPLFLKKSSSLNMAIFHIFSTFPPRQP